MQPPGQVLRSETSLDDQDRQDRPHLEGPSNTFCHTLSSSEANYGFEDTADLSQRPEVTNMAANLLDIDDSDESARLSYLPALSAQPGSIILEPDSNSEPISAVEPCLTDEAGPLEQGYVRYFSPSPAVVQSEGNPKNQQKPKLMDRLRSTRNFNTPVKRMIVAGLGLSIRACEEAIAHRNAAQTETGACVIPPPLTAERSTAINPRSFPSGTSAKDRSVLEEYMLHHRCIPVQSVGKSTSEINHNAQVDCMKAEDGDHRPCDQGCSKYELAFRPKPDDESVFRMVIISDLPLTVTLSDVMGRVCGGAIVSTKMLNTAPITGTMTAMIVFLHGKSAAEFVAYAKHHPLFFAGRRAHVTHIMTATWPLSVELQRKIIVSGASRCLSITQPSAGISMMQVKEGLLYDRYTKHPRIQTMLDNGQGTITVVFETVNAASAAYSRLKQMASFSRNAISFAKDPCDLPVPTFAEPADPQFLVTKTETDDELIAVHLSDEHGSGISATCSKSDSERSETPPSTLWGFPPSTRRGNLVDNNALIFSEADQVAIEFDQLRFFFDNAD